MEHNLGCIRVRVVRGINLAAKDAFTSDPYVVLKLGKQKLKTSVKKRCLNPEWNEDLTLSISDPTTPITLATSMSELMISLLHIFYCTNNLICALLEQEVYDKDRFTKDDKMGEAEIDIESLVYAVRMGHLNVPDGTAIRRVQPTEENCLTDESPVMWNKGGVTQDMILRLRNVQRGEIELKLKWIDGPGTKQLYM